MGLEDFERELAEEKTSRESREDSRREDRDYKHRHRSSHHRSHRHDRESRDEERRHRHKRHRERDREEDEDRKRHRKRHRSDSPKHREEHEEREDVKVFDSPAEDDEEDEWVEKEAITAPPEEDVLDQRVQNLKGEKVQRDAWMQEPSGMDVEVVASRKPKPPPSQFVGATDDHGFKPHNQNLADLERDFDSDAEEDEHSTQNAGLEEPSQHEVSYTFGDSGSSWRMTKLKAVYRTAAESGKDVDEVAVERYGSLRDFDDAREEEREMDRRKTYGSEYVGSDKPSGELFQERKMREGVTRSSKEHGDGVGTSAERQDQAALDQDSTAPPLKTVPLDATALNKLKAQLMKARLRKAPNLAQLEDEYQIAEEASLANSAQPDVIVLNNMENRMLASGRGGEVSAVSGKRGRERGLVVENEDMSIEDMVRQERRTKGGWGNEGKAFAERIAKDGKFVDDLDYMDDNAEKLSKKVVQSDTNLRNVAVGDFQKMQRALEHCPLCHHENRSGNDALPAAPVVSLGTRTYLTLPTEPEVAKGGAVIVPIQHRMNLLECDEDEWEEMRNFMKSLTRLYDSQGKGVIFYENAAHMHSKRGHAALNVVPLPSHLADTAPAYFKEAILAAAEQWSQHKPIIDTLALSQKAGYGKLAFRKAMVKEMPYFHVFFSLDGGMGHVIEDERKWAKGDLFAREVIGGMLDRGPEVVKKQGRWQRHDRRVEAFRKKWSPWDWTKILMEQ